MKASVIITAYNLEKYIAEAIQSVLTQTCPADEIIVVDDCSTDGTAGIIQAFAPAVRYVKMAQNSGGLSATFHGFKQVTGDIVFFLDGDDYWMPNKIEFIMSVYEAQPKMGIVSHDYIRIDANGRKKDVVDETQQNILRILRTRYTAEEQSEAFKESILGKKGFWGGSAYSLRRSVVDIEKFDSWRSSFEFIRYTYLDLILPTFVLINHPTTMVGYVHKPLFAYRQHGQNTSGNTIPEVAAAKKALRMGHCTTMATCALLDKHAAYNDFAAVHRLHILEYEYLNNIYDDQKLAACKKFLYLSKNLWKPHQIVKEAQRLGLSLLFGAKTFLLLKYKMA